MRGPFLVPTVLLILAAGCGRESATTTPSEASDPGAVSANVPFLGMPEIFPDPAVLPRDYMQSFSADIVFPDGTRQPISSAWEADPAIGSVYPAIGFITSLNTVPALPPGQTTVHGTLLASGLLGEMAGAHVMVFDESVPIDDEHYTVCGQFSSGGETKKFKVECPHIWASTVTILFPEGKGARVDYKDAKGKMVPGEEAPATKGRLDVTIDQKTGLVEAEWRNGLGNGQVEIPAAKGMSQVSLSFPKGSDATLTEKLKFGGYDRDNNKTITGANLMIPELKGKPVNDVHILTRLVRNGKVVMKDT